MISYLTGTASRACERIAFQRKIGLMIQPRNAGSYSLILDRYPFWAADNGAFTRRAGGFSPAAFRAMLALAALRERAKRCLFVAAPDRLIVTAETVIGDAAGTLEQFHGWSGELRGAGYRVALVAQNGLEEMLDRVPWDALDVLFIGGDDAWKESAAAAACVAAARGRGKRAHMGRVNSLRRLSRAAAMFCDTADGGLLRFGPTENVPRLEMWADAIATGAQLSLFDRGRR